jgi:YD repeat-containing protein
VLASYAYSYDPGNRLTQEIDDGGAPITYVYDGNGQLLQAGTQTYSYDLNGNPTGSSQVIGANNQLSSTSTDTYTHLHL